jgi:hypothetical protein
MVAEAVKKSRGCTHHFLASYKTDFGRESFVTEGWAVTLTFNIFGGLMGNTDNIPSDAEVKRMTDNAVNTPKPMPLHEVHKMKDKSFPGKSTGTLRRIYGLGKKNRDEHKSGIPVEGWESSNWEGPSRTYNDGRFTGKGKNRKPKSKPYTGKSNNT